jgi:hypothetical protein
MLNGCIWKEKEKDHLGSIAFERAQNLGGTLAFDIPYSGWHCLGVREYVQRLNTMTSFKGITYLTRPRLDMTSGCCFTCHNHVEM